MKLARYKNHSIELVIDRMRANPDDAHRLESSVTQALKQGGKLMMILDLENGEVKYFSQMLMDAENGLSYAEPAPHNFSFNSSQGACPTCKGLGEVNIVDKEKIMPNLDKSIYEGVSSLLAVTTIRCCFGR